jgi:Protein of unknown function (DUF1153)
MSHDDAHLRDLGLEPTQGSHPAANRKAARSVSGNRQDAKLLRDKRANYIVGPNGDIITRADLPSPRTTRWVIRRKAEVVLAVHGGLLSLDDACRRYRLTAEEFFSWEKAIARHGLLGLRSTHVQDYRNDKS